MRVFVSTVSEIKVYIYLYIVNPEGSMIHQYYKKSLKNAIKFTIETPLDAVVTSCGRAMP